jgi:TolA-binding protein
VNDSALDNSQSATTRLSQVWQLPALGISLVMFGFGLYLSQPGDQTFQYVEALNQARALITSGQLDKALTQINDLRGGIGAMSDDIQSRFYLLRGDAMYLGQRSKGWSHPDNYAEIIESYRTARTLGPPLDHDHLERLADSLAALEDFGSALEYLTLMGDAGSYLRQDMYKRAIRHALDHPGAPITPFHTPEPIDAKTETQPDPDADTEATAVTDDGPQDLDETEPPTSQLAYQNVPLIGDQYVTDLIHGLLAEPKLTKENDIWATARSAEMLIRQDRIKLANSMLLVRIARLQDEPDELKGELMLMLGRTFLIRGEGEPGDKWISSAIGALPDADPLRGEALVEKGRILFNEDNPLGAMDYFNEVIERYSDTRAYPGGLVGMADCEARTGATRSAMNHYRESVQIAKADPVRHAQLRDLLLESLQAQHDLRFGQGRYDQAMEYLEIESALYEEPGPPALMLKRARTLEKLGRQKLDLNDDDADTVAAWDRLSDEDKEIAANYYADSADAYLRHAHAVAIKDDRSYGQSLWNAGDFYDKAGLHKMAILAFREYVENKTEDPRSLSAMFRLAQAQRADEEYEQAITLYRRLIEEHAKSPESYASLVPLARSHIALGAPGDISQAEHVLKTVVNSHPAIRPESREYRDALAELGQLYYHRGEGNDYAEAASLFERYVDRYGSEGPMPELRFQLGDAYRKMVSRIESDLGGSMPSEKRGELRSMREQHLRAAKECFNAVITAYEGSPDTERSELQELYLRNAYFYRADCAFDLEQYEGPEGAIELYNKVQQRYRNHPSALLALMQIFNSQAKLGRWDEARTTNNRAMVLLRSIPDEAFDDPRLPMNRKHWQNWLEGTSIMPLDNETATVPTE